MQDHGGSEAAPESPGGWRRLVAATRYSFAGLDAAVRHEAAFRQELGAAGVLIPLAFLLPASGSGRALMVASVVLVLIVELVNSAIEAAVDHASLEPHPLAGRAKDYGSAAVLLALVQAVAIWVLVLWA
ncbi:MAG TPA: diacylglycerol kinase [Rhodocyclaceae bacterium]|nr:diacylglycerol kinase [Armatimonadota bacterium]OIP08725.1 MAG: diacylglycerol kinase [Betaproteobacteria bacterium CG2_30_68_42]PIV72269.1 MAG: diacylglycerol kinase [Rhodocyclales bacterium CG17_big_fil_post_rev_8_21_14_2_50_68_7]PJA58557.1 MAG: diacylglycerol kinase [Rhodocyclales bacterium CG_4_9_14_3_um_filter_68_10]HCX32446.1 diacylglycerol kinase [Rhodocyclaceae bacterium]